MDDTDTVVLDRPVADEQQRRRRRVRMRTGRVIVLAILAAAIAIGMAWLLSWWSPVPVREVTVVGATPETEAQVLVSAGIPLGTPLRDIDRQAVTDRVQALPGIDGTTLVLVRPWTVSIEVVERFPFAVAEQNGQWTILDVTGYPVRDVPERPVQLPQVSGPPEAWAAALTAVAALPEELRDKVAKITAGDDVTMVLRSGAEVEWGAPERNEEKSRVLAALLQYRASGYNVSVPERPATTGELDLPKENREVVEEG